MALVTQITVQNVRVHKAQRLTLLPSITVIAGPNGSGKTTLLEALYIALRGTSFKGSDKDILKTGADWYRIDVDFDDGTKRTVKFDSTKLSGKKKFVVDDKTHYRLPQRYKYPVVLFEPDDLRLLSGSPSRRREYFDRFIGQLDPHYSTAIHKYERALKQRNSLLKRLNVSPDELFVWNVALSTHGEYIVARRKHFVQRIQEQLDGIYSKIAGSAHKVALTYSHAEVSKQKLLHDLHQNVKKDMMTGFTSVGPHRHDFLFSYKEAPAVSVASRGEVRSIMLALKFIEVDIIEETFHIKPVILLDDVFSELDLDRQKNLTTKFVNHQIILTSVNTAPLGRNMTFRLKG